MHTCINVEVKGSRVKKGKEEKGIFLGNSDSLSDPFTKGTRGGERNSEEGETTVHLSAVLLPFCVRHQQGNTRVRKNNW